MVRFEAKAKRSRRAGERGFTLIEVIVSLVIVALISGAVAGIFAVSLRILGSGGPQTRLFGSHDLMILEETLGQDGARAACMKIAGTAYGSCGSGFAKVTCTSTDLCIGWPQLSGPACHIADYAAGANSAGTRTEYSVSSSGSVTNLGANPLARLEHVTITIGTPATVTVASTTPSYTWVRSVSVTITDAGTPNGASQTLTLHPAATDPAGPSAKVTSGGTPC